MKLHDGDRVEEVSVWACKVGRRFHRMELNAEDFTRLSQLPSEALATWFATWQLGFIPASMSYRGAPTEAEGPLETGDHGPMW